MNLAQVMIDTVFKAADIIAIGVIQKISSIVGMWCSFLLWEGDFRPARTIPVPLKRADGGSNQGVLMWVTRR